MNVGSGPTGQYIPETGVWIEERNRREAEDRVGGASSEYGDQPQVYYSKSYTPQTKR